MPLCFAEDVPEEDISQYFNEEQTEQLEGHLEYNSADEPMEVEQNAVQLDNEAITSQINFSKPKKIGTKSLLQDSKKPSFEPMKTDIRNASKFSSQEYMINPVSAGYSYKFGKFSLGTSYDSYLDSANASYTTALFSKYEWKHFALSTSFSKNTSMNSDSFSDKIYIVPELKLTKRLSILNVMQTDINQINKKNEVVLRYTPHFKKYADDVTFELGAGQSFYEDQYVKSSLRFSTKFKL